MKRRELVLLADYGCFPVWEPGAASTNVDPASLPISGALQAALRTWSEAYDAILDVEDPRQSGFISPDDEASFREEGTVLWSRLRDELGQDFSVTLRLVTGLRG